MAAPTSASTNQTLSCETIPDKSIPAITYIRYTDSVDKSLVQADYGITHEGGFDLLASLTPQGTEGTYVSGSATHIVPVKLDNETDLRTAFCEAAKSADEQDEAKRAARLWALMRSLKQGQQSDDSESEGDDDDVRGGSKKPEHGAKN